MNVYAITELLIITTQRYYTIKEILHGGHVGMRSFFSHEYDWWSTYFYVVNGGNIPILFTAL